MNVILSRCESEAPKSKTDAQMNHIVLNSWRNVLSELNEIFAVFIHGKEAGKFDLGKVDTKLTHIVNQRNKMISYLTSHIIEIEKEKLSQEQELNERDKQFAEIRAKYANMASHQKVLEADLNSQRTALATLTSETKMCEEIDKKIEAIANSS
jgi:ribosomal protein S15P/S13E